MGVFTFEEEFTSTVAPSRLFKAFALDADNLLPKVAPEAAKSVEILQGNGGPGTVKKITFEDGKYMKNQVDFLDQDNLAYGNSFIEGDVLSAEVEKISHETKLVAAPGGGSIVKVTTKLYTIGDAQIDEEKAREGKEMATGLFMLVESYLQANPDAYN